MKRKIIEQVEIPEGALCEYTEGNIKCKKDSQEFIKKINLPGINVKIESDKIVFYCEKGNKKDYKIIKTLTAHLRNLFNGLTKKYIYHLEAVNVHFPMTLKIEGNELIIGNFLGEKVPRKAKILQNVEVEIKNQDITISSNDKESAGQTAGNFEKATKVTKKDNRIFQDGIYITEKPKSGGDE